MMRSVTYISTATTLLSTPELLQLLEQCRVNNQKNNLTGMLLYKQGSFIQVLEGDEEPLQRTYARILKDPRHHSIIRLLEQSIEERQFPEWAMGFADLQAMAGGGNMGSPYGGDGSPWTDQSVSAKPSNQKLDLNRIPGFSNFMADTPEMAAKYFTEEPTRAQRLLLHFR